MPSSNVRVTKESPKSEMLRRRKSPGVPFRARSRGIETLRSTSSVGWPGKRVITWTWVSVGSGNASTVRRLKAYQPPNPRTAARRNEAILFSRQDRRRASIMPGPLRTLPAERQLVVEENGALLHDDLAALEPGQDGNATVAHRTRHDRPLDEVPLAILDVEVLVLPVGDQGRGRNLHD